MMLAEERRLQLVEWTRNEGRIDAGIAAKKLRVATETVRRDLDVLERRGVLRRVHGGAISQERFHKEYTIPERENINPDAKARIANAAAAFIPERGCIFVDGGTTTEQLATHLRDKPELLVITNNIRLASRIGGSGTKVHVLSGQIRPASLSTVGARAAEDLAEWNASVCFLGANGLTADLHMTAFDADESSVKKVMMRNSEERILLVDHSKFRNTYPATFGHARELDRVVCDLETSLAEVEALRALDLEVTLA